MSLAKINLYDLRCDRCGLTRRHECEAGCVPAPDGWLLDGNWHECPACFQADHAESLARLARKLNGPDWVVGIEIQPLYRSWSDIVVRIRQGAGAPISAIPKEWEGDRVDWEYAEEPQTDDPAG